MTSPARTSRHRTLPDRFTWGTASSATQCEGAAPQTTWSRWEQSGRVPSSKQGNGFLGEYERDWEMLAAHGLTGHRLSIEWARIEPRPGAVDHGAVEHYSHVLRTAGEAGVDVWVTLHDQTLPGWFEEDEHGFLDRHSRGYFWPRHVDRMGEYFGELVAGWIPVHDPYGYARHGWLTGDRPPGRQDPEKFLDALLAIHLTNLEAWKLLRSGDRPVATSMAVVPMTAAVRSRLPDERTAAATEARRLDQLMFGCWADALDDGMFALPGRAVRNIPEMAEAFDVVGFTYDHGLSVFADGTTEPYPADARVGPTGDAPWAEGLGVAIRKVHDANLRRPLLVTGCGVATPADDPRQDEWRVEVLRDSMDEVLRARADGIDLRGFFHAAAVDRYEWEHGFDVQYGLFDRNRRPKDSARLAATYAGAAPVDDEG